MKQLFSCLLFIGICQIAISQTIGNPFRGLNKIKIPKEGVKSFSFQILNKGNITSHIEIRTRLVQGEKVNLAVLYGSQSESCMLSKSDRNFTSVTLCHDTNDKFASIHVMIHSFDVQKESVIEIEAGWKNMALTLDEPPRNIKVSPQEPATFLIYHSDREDYSRKDRFRLDVDSIGGHNDEICMIVSVYNKECPLHNKPGNVKSSEMWATGLKSATMTIRADKFCFNDNFYVSVVVLPNNDECHRHRRAGDECHLDYERKREEGVRQKEVQIKITKIKDKKSYIIPIFMACITMFVLILTSYLVVRLKNYEDLEFKDAKTEQPEEEGMVEETKVEPTENGDLPVGGPEDPVPLDVDWETEVYPDHADAPDVVDGQLSDTQAAHELCKTCTEKIDSAEPERDPHRIQRVKAGMNRLKDRPAMADNKIILKDKNDKKWTEDVWFRRNRSKVYIYLVPLISIFYFVPAIQFAFQAKETEELTGSMDLCYHNFKCARPWFIFSDFNHVISNISYFIFGLVFIHLCYLKTKQLPEDKHPKNDHNVDTGLVQQMSIFYAMGFALAAQGAFSVCYHVCPTNLSLQFDTTMMYVICMLCCVKLYQFRHPDATPNAYSTMGALGILVLIEALALYSSSWIVYGLFLAFYVGMTIFIAFDAYYLGIGRTDYVIALALAKDIVGNWSPVPRKPPTAQDEVDASRVRNILACTGRLKAPSWVKYPRRFLFSLIFVAVNFAHAIYIAIKKAQDPTKNITHVVLNCLAGNLILYLCYYLLRKKCCHTTEAEYIKEKYKERKWELTSKCSIPALISPGTFFTFLALVFAVIGIGFYANRSANRNLTPAESRDLNVECALLDFYDSHDLWHFFSAAGIFMAFMALLNIDDDILFVPRDKIDIF